jgi:hypothetical protein
MLEILFDPPWWFPAGLAVVGAFLFYQGNRTQDRKQRNAGTGVILAVMLLMLTAYLIDTPVEKVQQHTRDLATSAGNADWTTFGNLLDPQVSFAGYRNKTALLAGAKLTAGHIGLKKVTITGMETRRQADIITTNIRCMSEQDRTIQPAITDWQLDWRETNGEWKLYQVTPMQNQTIGPQQIESHLVRP